MKQNITAIILTFNEEIHLARCLNNVKLITDNIYVIDSYSTDKTCEIAVNLGAIVIQNEYINQAQQFQWALDNIQCESEWVLRLDADEYLTEKLIKEIQFKIPHLSQEITGCYLPRDVIFLEKNIKHGRIHPPKILRLWRNGAVYMEQRWMDEHCILKYGHSITLKGRFIDHNLQGLTKWIQKHNSYANREIIVTLGKQFGLLQEAETSSKQNDNKGLYYRFPSFIRSLVYFLIRYIFLGGFLDGKPGLIWATLQAFWYRFLVDSKLEELYVRIGPKPSKEQIKLYFKQEFGIEI